MEHKKIARLLELADALALLLALFVFYLYTPLCAGSASPRWIPALMMAVEGLPYLAAIACYFEICKNIGRDRSFCRENVLQMRRISRLLLLSAGLWLLALAALLAGLPPANFLSGIAHPRLGALLALLATLAVALVARMLALLLDRAQRLQADSDLTV